MVSALRLSSLAALPVLAWAVLACLGDGGGNGGHGSQENGAQSASRARQEPVSDVLPQRIATGASARGLSSPARMLGQPVPWSGKRVLPFHRAMDRATAKARTLEARAEMRPFDGAPPAMRHSATFGEGTKTCLDCHETGMTMGERVAHPMSHAPLANCTQCHVESENRDLPPAIAAVASGFDGFRLIRGDTTRPPGMPPAMPHPITMRNRCLACHGEFGHAGLGTSHPERALCVQCHLPGPSKY